MKNISFYFAAGQFALAVSILLDHFAEESNPVSFAIGLLTSLAIVFNIAFLANARKEKRQ